MRPSGWYWIKRVPDEPWQPFDTLDAVLRQMIEAHVGKPCPTGKEIRQWTGMPRRRIWPYLEGMRERGLIEIEMTESRAEGRDPKRRRMRVAGGEWTLWTQRGPMTAEAPQEIDAI